MFRIFAEHRGRRAVLMFNAGPMQCEAIGCYRGDPLYHASLDPAEYESLLDGIGFDIVAHAVEDREVEDVRSGLRGRAPDIRNEALP